MRTWTADEVRDLPVVVDLVTAGSALGMGRTASYELARRGEFPVAVLKVGHRYRVVTAHLRELLGVQPDGEPAGAKHPAALRALP
ncbi:hypothetical protein IN07_03355 [Modestobacter caceresii]|uniref:Helix-turn-helix domain-containing protein n=1 Tax=Modestobacter caceresii TaxID=1522368 RepID=A0A098YCU5_9ACTN|nr:hypothetical protein [Modestobacter caceresii]KGH48252.1 hypothetical protein IN07_03355 [Modestobacter caceresii]